VREVYKRIAALRDEDEEVVRGVLVQNAIRVFKLPPELFI